MSVLFYHIGSKEVHEMCGTKKGKDAQDIYLHINFNGSSV